MTQLLALAAELITISQTLDRDAFGQELEDHCWPFVDELSWENPIDILTFNAALYYGETLHEHTPAHLLSGGVYNEWVAAIKAERFSIYSQQKRVVHKRAQAILLNPLIKDLDPFWLMFPNNINLNNWNPADIAALMEISAHSNSIKAYKPFGVLLFIHGHPLKWVAANPDDPTDQAVKGLAFLEQPLQHIAQMNYKNGTFQ